MPGPLLSRSDQWHLPGAPQAGTAATAEGEGLPAKHRLDAVQKSGLNFSSR